MDSEELVRLIIHEATSAIGTDVCSLYLLNPGGRELAFSATNGLNERMVGRVTMKVSEGVTGWVAETRQPMLVPDVSLEPHWKWVPGLDEERFRSMLSVPIESGPRLVGVLNVQSVAKRDFTGEDIDFLRAIAGQVAGILERSELQRRLEAQLSEIQLSHDIHERFTRLSLEGAGIGTILEAVGSLAGGRTALYSLDGFRVRGAGESAERLPARIQLPPAVSTPGAREIRMTAGRPPRALDLVPVRAGGDLLGVLARHPGRVLSRDSLLDLTQGRNAGSFERSIDVLVSRIRRKIEPDPQAATLIKTVRSGGYMFTPRVEPISAEAVTAAGH